MRPQHRGGTVPSLPRPSGSDTHGAAQERRQRRIAMYTAQGGRCWYCDGVMRLYPVMTGRGDVPPDYPTFEHITPLERLGRQIRPETPEYLLAPNNQVLVCYECNARRNRRPLTEFIAELRQAGKVRGIVARIKHLVNDHIPEPSQAEAFNVWMTGALTEPRRPADALAGLPVELAAELLPDPSAPAPRRRPLLDVLRRLLRWLTERRTHERQGQAQAQAQRPAPGDDPPAGARVQSRR